MSALAQARVPLIHSLRPLSELELLRTVSQITWNGTDKHDSLSAIAAALLRVPGLTGFQFEPQSTLPHLAPYRRLKTATAIPEAYASSAVSANGQSWGEIRIFLDPYSSSQVESPVRVARFVGQQIALLLQRLSLLNERRLLNSRLEKLNLIMRRRKLIYAAAVVLARQRNIASSEAIAELVKYARSSRRKILAVSESLLIGYGLSKPTRSQMRRLSRNG